MLIVPVSYTTLNNRKTRETYLALLTRMPKQYAQYFVFELRGLPASAPQARVAELLVALQPFSSLRIVEVVPRGLPIERLARCGVFAASIDLDPVEHPIDLRALVATCGKFDLRVVAYGARNAALVSGAAKAGAAFIAGPAVAPRLEKPRGAYPFDPLAEEQRVVEV